MLQNILVRFLDDGNTHLARKPPTYNGSITMVFSFPMYSKTRVVPPRK